ncbi:perilipin-3 isoform X1 [Dipodomys merriami]|uniref:perilipin-3 isoform X1 n=1 Tax=Dipodomys merriami TaxID=94247 RepID=UPI003855834C
MSRAESPKTETAWAEADTHIHVHTHETEDELMPQVDAHVHPHVHPHAHPHAHPHIHAHPYPHVHAHVHAHAHLPEEELVPQMHTHTHTHVTEEGPAPQADASTQGMEEPVPQPGVVDRVAAMPLISSTCDMVSAAYTSTKESHPNVRAVCDMAEKGIRTFTEAAVSGAQPILSKLEPQITSASEYAHRGLDRLQTVPILQQTSDKVLADTKDLVSTKMTEAREMFSNTVSSAKDTVATSVTEAVDLTMSMLSMGMNSVMGTRMGQMVTSRVDTMLGKSEDWVDNHLPLTDEELARLAASVEGCDPASVQQQRREQSYFVRLGSLSERLRQRACAHALGRLRGAGQGAQDALQQLAHALSLIESVKQSVDQKLGEGQEKLSQMWMNWKNMKTPNKKNSERDPDPAEPEVPTGPPVFPTTLRSVDPSVSSDFSPISGGYWPCHLLQEVHLAFYSVAWPRPLNDEVAPPVKAKSWCLSCPICPVGSSVAVHDSQYCLPWSPRLCVCMCMRVHAHVHIHAPVLGPELRVWALSCDC